MRCYYDVLGVDPSATDQDIRSAYKKLALQWHPDKNLDNVEEAQQEFVLIQQAFDVLNDARERRWYDSHRDAILRGCTNNPEELLLDLTPFCSSSCYKGYTDDDGGFYQVYRNVFQLLANEESIYINDAEETIPEFGTADSDYKEVVHAFYAYWSSYYTKNTFSWLDPYHSVDAINRRRFRMLEKENKKVRMVARKERNEEVRNLVAFVKKRDKRIEMWRKKVEEEAKENRKRKEEKERNEIIRRKLKNMNQAENDESSWTKFANLQKELKEVEEHIMKEFGETDEQWDDQNIYYYCDICSKSFLTCNAFANHERSKKHKERFKIVQQFLEKENIDFENVDEKLEDLTVDETELVSKEDVNESNQEDELAAIHEQEPTTNLEGQEVEKNEGKIITTQRNEMFKDQTPTNMKEISHVKEINEKNLLNTEEVDGRFNVSSTSQMRQNINHSENKPKRKKRGVGLNEFQCQACGEVFQSKNKLFQHLLSSGHARPLKIESEVKEKKKWKK